MIAIPALAGCLDDVCSRYYTIEEILDDQSWFNAICISYKRRTGNSLTFEDFESMNKLELAQMVLNSASCNALKDFDYSWSQQHRHNTDLYYDHRDGTPQKDGPLGSCRLGNKKHHIISIMLYRSPACVPSQQFRTLFWAHKSTPS